MPAVTELSRPNGEPMAITHSPTFKRDTSPTFTAGSPVAWILTTATSVRLSAPIILALNSRLSGKVTRISSAPSTTWALVMMKPSAVKINPEPTPLGCDSSGAGVRPWRGACLGALGAFGVLGIGMPKNRRNNSWVSSSMPPPLLAGLRAFSSVRILTTDGPTCSTNSVKSGNPLTMVCCASEWLGASANVRSPKDKNRASKTPGDLKPISFISYPNSNLISAQKTHSDCEYTAQRNPCQRSGNERFATQNHCVLDVELSTETNRYC